MQNAQQQLVEADKSPHFGRTIAVGSKLVGSVLDIGIDASLAALALLRVMINAPDARIQRAS